ncbi:hypothetical protein ABJI51_15850 [Amycolatopsis sp. NEAU-NG30]|uniref:Serine/threonine protein kinase n=1 Tax=Amycolatopsis melonis TaxID=3156488 RepID=A0ABV0LE51_9PSEU
MTDVVVHEQRPPETEAKPRFVASKHGPESRPVITLTPVPPKPASAPRRPAPSPPRSALARPLLPRRATKAGAKVLLGFLGLVLLAVSVDRLGTLVPEASTSGQGTSATEPSCPGGVAQWLPNAGSGTILIAQYDTGQHVVTICRDSRGQYHYDGQLKGKPATSETHISLAASKTATGFQARNAGYLYEIDGPDLRLTKYGKPIQSWRLTRLTP